MGLQEKPTDSGQQDRDVTPSPQLCEPRGQGLSTALYHRDTTHPGAGDAARA